MLSINFMKSKTTFSLSLQYNSYESCLYVNKTQLCIFECFNILNPYKICLESVSKDFKINKMADIALNDTVSDFSIDYGLIDIKDILKIHEYLKKNII